MKILVTGGAGFIGAHLVRELQRRGAEIFVLDNFSTGSKKNLPANVEIIEADICTAELTKIIGAGKFDAVIHLAGQTTVNESLKNPALDAHENILGTINLLEAIRQSGTVRKIIFASTAAVYGNCTALPITENQPLNPLSFYALTKLTAENYLQLYKKICGVDFVILRFANVYGEYQGDKSEGGVISIFAKKILRDESLTIYGDGEQTRDFIHAEDVARGICQALTTSNSEIFNISTQTEISLNALIESLEKVTGRKIPVNYQSARIGDIKKSALSNERAKKFLSWQPEIKLTEGLRRTLKYFEGAL